MAFPLLQRQAVLAAKAEAVPGTAESLTAAEAAFNVFNVALAEEIPEVEREGQGTSLDMLASVPGARMGRLTFQSHLVGNGSSGIPGYASTLLPACGMVAASQVYGWSSGSSSATTLTMGFYEDGVKRGIAGAMGTWTITFATGGPAVIDWEFIGKLIDESDVAILAPTYPTIIPPRFASGTLTLDSIALPVAQVVLRAGNELAMREDPTDVTGYSTAYIVDRRPGGSVDPEATVVATKNWMTFLTASTQAAFALDIGTVSNNTMNIDAPKCQVISKTRGVRNKFRTNELELKFGRSASAGDDSLTLGYA